MPDSSISRLSTLLPGACVYIPVRVTRRHQLCKLLGYSAACRLSSRHPGTTLHIPSRYKRCSSSEKRVRDAQIAQEYLTLPQGTKHRANVLAAKYRVSTRHVYRIIKSRMSSEHRAQVV